MDEKKKQVKEIGAMLFILVVIIIVLISMVLIVQQVKKENVECLKDPLVYGAKQIVKSNDAPVSCTCSLFKPGVAALKFNSEKRWIEDD